MEQRNRSTSYDESIVTFLDVLGFSTLVEQTTAKAIEIIDRLNNVMTLVEMEVIEHHFWGRQFSARLFSDCICLSSPFSQDGLDAVTESVAMLAMMFSAFGVFLRGGIANGRHYENDRMIFREALVKAYQLESKSAVFPRVILFSDLAHSDQFETPKRCWIDDDGYSSLTTLTGVRVKRVHPPESHPWALHKKHILAGLWSTQSLPRVLEKYRWLAKYHNRKVEEVRSRNGDRELGVNESMLISDNEAAV